jgi:hypothetical protein
LSCSIGKADFIPVAQILDDTNGFFNKDKNEIIIEVYFTVVFADITKKVLI